MKRSTQTRKEKLDGNANAWFLALTAIAAVALATALLLTQNQLAQQKPTETTPQATQEKALQQETHSPPPSSQAELAADFIINNSFVQASSKTGFREGAYYDSVSFENKGERQASFRVLEAIPKKLASTTEEATLEGYDLDNFEIILEDPVLLVAEKLNAGGKVQRTIIFKNGKSSSAVIRLVIPEPVSREQIEQLANALSQAANAPGMTPPNAFNAQTQLNNAWQSQKEVEQKISAVLECAAVLSKGEFNCGKKILPQQLPETVFALAVVSNVNPLASESVTIESDVLEKPLTLLKGELAKYASITLSRKENASKQFEATITVDASKLPRKAGMLWNSSSNQPIIEVSGELRYSPDGINSFAIPASIIVSQQPPQATGNALDDVITSPRTLSFYSNSNTKKPFIAINNYPFPLTVEGCGFPTKTILPPFSATKSLAALGLNDFTNRSCVVSDDGVPVATLSAQEKQADETMYATESESGSFQQDPSKDSLALYADTPAGSYDSMLCSDNYCSCDALKASLEAFNQEFSAAAKLFASKFSSAEQYAQLYPQHHGNYKRTQIFRTADYSYECDLSGLAPPLAALRLEGGEVYAVTLSAPLNDYGVNASTETASATKLEEKWAYATSAGTKNDRQEFNSLLQQPQYG
ncbi:MAG: hypothetical protein ACP5IG_00195 [Candidatus Micrarchaeia archaeon]